MYNQLHHNQITVIPLRTFTESFVKIYPKPWNTVYLD